MARALAPLFAIVALLSAALPVAADEPEPVATDAAAYAPDRVVVRWREPSRGASVVAAQDLGVIGTVAESSGAALVTTNGRPVEQVLAELRADPSVAYAEPDYVVQLADPRGVAAVPVNDPRSGEQYSLDRMLVRDAWHFTTGASNVVAVLDTGVQFDHPDLQGRLLPGHDFVNGDADASDDNTHGTWVSGIIAANANDGWGIAGISWSDRILPVKVMNASGIGYTSWLTAGIIWAADQGASVINMSVGGFPYSAYVQDAVNYAWSKGAVLVGAAGNNRREEVFYPASYDHVISVSATQADDEFTNWSSFGPRVTMSAPGGSVLTTNCDRARTGTCQYSGNHIFISGTSFATPNTAGVVALIRARNPTWSNQQVVDHLVATVDDLGYPGWDNRYGYGRVNAFRAVGGSVAAPGTSTGDALERNNTMAAAWTIPLATTLHPSIHPAGDIDYFGVHVPRAGRLDVRVWGVVDSTRPVKSSLPIDPVVELLTTDGTRLALVNAVNQAGVELASATVSGPMRLVVHVENWWANGNPSAYTIRAEYVDTVAPVVVARSPLPGSVGLNRFVAPAVSFDEAVQGVSASSVVLRDTVTGALVPAGVSYDPARGEARLRPAAQLAAQRRYRVELNGGVTDLAGNPLAATSWEFTTGLYGFNDIGGSIFISDIAWLAEAGITAGCSADRFCPVDPVTREQMATFLVRALHLPPAGTDYFTDDAASQHQSDINRLAASGITGGCGSGRFCPSAVVTREQMASFLTRALRLPPTGTDYFTDDASSQHQSDINRLAASGITGGCGSGRFCPRDAVTREQMAAFLHRAFD